MREIRFNLVADAEDVDGVAELWFDSREDFEAAYATDIGKAVAQDSLDHVSARVRLLVEENQILTSCPRRPLTTSARPSLPPARWGKRWCVLWAPFDAIR